MPRLEAQVRCSVRVLARHRLSETPLYSVYDQPYTVSVHAQVRPVLHALASKLPAVAAHLDAAPGLACRHSGKAVAPVSAPHRAVTVLPAQRGRTLPRLQQVDPEDLGRRADDEPVGREGDGLGAVLHVDPEDSVASYLQVPDPYRPVLPGGRNDRPAVMTAQRDGLYPALVAGKRRQNRCADLQASHVYQLVLAGGDEDRVTVPVADRRGEHGAAITIATGPVRRLAGIKVPHPQRSAVVPGGDDNRLAGLLPLPEQETMPNPCEGVPRLHNRWCRRGKPIPER